MFGRGGITTFIFATLVAVSFGSEGSKDFDEKDKEKADSFVSATSSEKFPKEEKIPPKDGGSGDRPGGITFPTRAPTSTAEFDEALRAMQAQMNQPGIDRELANRQYDKFKRTYMDQFPGYLGNTPGTASGTGGTGGNDTVSATSTSPTAPGTPSTTSGATQLGSLPVVAAPSNGPNASGNANGNGNGNPNANAQDLLGGATPLQNQINQPPPSNRPPDSALVQLNGGAKQPVAQTGGGDQMPREGEVVERTHRSAMDPVVEASRAQAFSDLANGTSIEPIPGNVSKKVEQDIARATKAIQLAEKTGDEKALSKELDALQDLATQTEDPISPELRERVLAGVAKIQEGRALARVREGRQNFEPSSVSANSVSPSVSRVQSYSAPKFDDKMVMGQKLPVDRGGASDLNLMTAKALLMNDASVEKTAALDLLAASTASSAKVSPVALVDVPFAKSRGTAARLLNRVLALLQSKEASTTHSSSQKGKAITSVAAREKFKLPTVVASFFSAGDSSVGDDDSEPFRFEENSYGALVALMGLISFFPSLALSILVLRNSRHRLGAK